MKVHTQNLSSFNNSVSVFVKFIAMLLKGIFIGNTLKVFKVPYLPHGGYWQDLWWLKHICCKEPVPEVIKEIASTNSTQMHFSSFIDYWACF